MKSIEGKRLFVGLNKTTGLPDRLETIVNGKRRSWLRGAVGLQIRNEVTGTTSTVSSAPSRFTVAHRWKSGATALTWEMSLTTEGKRTGHEVLLDFPLLSSELSVSTPTDRGVTEVSAYPTFRPPPYANCDWSGNAYVLPLVSVFDPKTDSALTFALPADANIPHLQVEWSEGKTLRLTLGHRGMGGGKPSALSLLLFAHEADYRSVLRTYSDLFPAYFNPPLPRGDFEGAFWYHHVHDHPDFEEMSRQHVRYLWSSFWFTHLGEYLPEEKEWEPYTYAKWWKLGQKMSDDKINTFVKEMHEHDLGTYAYFNVTEYGGMGGKGGDAARAEQILREKFADALMKNDQGQPIPTWEGAMAMNAGSRYSLWPFLQEQVRRHLTRLPELDGFVIDRLDWASVYDYGHQDDLTMIGDRPAENMALPVGEAVRAVCRLSHSAGKRVFVNQFWRVEVLRDVDGSCHESDYLAQRYLIPLRPASAWEQQKPYNGDLLGFEAQLKQRLQIALFPQMIAHEFPISQQGASPRAADLLEIYAPLFETLLGKRQVLLPHCVSVTGANDVNLFVNGAGHYVAPVTSRVRFLSRRTDATESVAVTLRVPDAAKLAWAHVYSADVPPYCAAVIRRGGMARVALDHHATASVVVFGRGPEPDLADKESERIAQTRDRLFPPHVGAAPTEPVAKPSLLSGLTKAVLKIKGMQFGASGLVTVYVDGREVGRITDSFGSFPVTCHSSALPKTPPTLRLHAGDEGTWLFPERIQFNVELADGKRYIVAEWTPGCSVASTSTTRDLVLPLQWRPLREVPETKARLESKDVSSGGKWKGKYGSRAAWLAGVTSVSTEQNGYGLQVTNASECVWADGVEDARVVDRPGTTAGQPRAACWHDVNEILFALTPPDGKPLRLTLYLLDYDHNGREMEVVLTDDMGARLSGARASKPETDSGVYLKWEVTGPVTVQVRKLAGYNAVVSGVFIDSAGE
ncbi:MAG: hypothetical protein HY318_07670 [Armatimonadetes bacterium]|nr:hypothetical protein [Armatimonadota bacterium]